mgnify:CR=1 FL=1
MSKSSNRSATRGILFFVFHLIFILLMENGFYNYGRELYFSMFVIAIVIDYFVED